MTCPQCKYENQAAASFCSNCGIRLAVVKETDYNTPVKNISVFFFVLLAYIILLHFTTFANNYTSLIKADSLFAVIVLIFFAADFKKSKHLFAFKNPNLNVIGQIFIFAPVLAMVVYFIAGWMNQNLLNKTEMIYYNEFSDSPSPFLFSIISIALFPAIFEEIAFRGILFDETRKITNLKSTILITAILFTLLHLSLLAILWIFPLGLYFGYLRAKYHTLMYGIVGHLTYNTSIILVQMMFMK